MFVRHHVDVVFSGHDHVYERRKPQRGIYYIVSGGDGPLRRGTLRPAGMTPPAGEQDKKLRHAEVRRRAVDAGAGRGEGRTGGSKEVSWDEYWWKSVAGKEGVIWVWTAWDGGEQRRKSLGAAYAPQD